MDGADGWVGVIVAAIAFAGKVAVDHWRSKQAAEQARQQAMFESTIGRYAERCEGYDAFRKSVHALLDGMDAGIYPMSLLYDVRDNWGSLRRYAPSEVIAAANLVVQALKPAIDKGPSDQVFVTITQGLRAFDDACRADAGFGPVPHIDNADDRRRRETARVRGKGKRTVARNAAQTSAVLDQSDDEAELTRIFLGDDLVRPAVRRPD